MAWRNGQWLKVSANIPGAHKAADGASVGIFIRGGRDSLGQVHDDRIQIVGPDGLNLVSYNVSGRRANPLEQAHRKFQSESPLSFYQLSWPADEQWSGETGELYRCSAQLFLDELLRLKDGKACLRAMIAGLPRRLNWQLAFLDAFHSHFQRALDVEKWWALQSLHFTGRDVLAQTWPFEESRRKLDEALHAEVEVRVGAGETPIYSTVKLQSIIREWDPARQTQAIRGMLGIRF